jgi:capsule synthesis protein PGA_cap
VSRAAADGPRDAAAPESGDPDMRILMRHVSPEEIPASEDLCSAADLDAHFAALGEPPFSLVAAGDIMLGDHAKRALKQASVDYPFEAVLPLLKNADIVLANLEGPLARKSAREARNYSYKVNPLLAAALARAQIGVLTLANNHSLDCGREGVLETLEALASAGAGAIGAGADRREAHRPLIRQAGPWRVGLLGYYWNERCAATDDLPGAAMGTPEALEADIGALRDRVDRVVVTYHWGIPYYVEPSPENRARARLAVDCGADVVIGHHPHIVQPFEIYRGCPIFYSVGNFTFGSRNSHAEGLLVAVRFETALTTVYAYPLYVKNRDPRVRFQPKVLRGAGADRALRRLAEISGPAGAELRFEADRGILRLRRSGAACVMRSP